jgi:hypothetical protein
MIQELAVASKQDGDIDAKIEAIKRKYGPKIQENAYLSELLAVNADDTVQNMEL